MPEQQIVAAEEGMGPPRGGRLRVYIGTYTHGASQGIYTGELDLASGRLAVARTAAARLENPSFLACDPARLRLYSVSEISDHEGQASGAVHAFAVDPDTGHLTLLGRRPSGGADPCHLSLDPMGRFVLVANYSGGTVSLLLLNANGSLAAGGDTILHEGSGQHPTRQNRPHAHAALLDPAGRYALVTDLGIDRILLYEVDADRGKLAPRGTAGEAKAGAGPRHLVFHPNGLFLFTINELDSTVTTWQYDGARGRLREVQSVSTLPDGFDRPNTAADIHVHPSGRFLYGSNRGHDGLALFAIDPETGRLTTRGHVSAGGENPRNFAIDPTGAFLLCAHQDSDTIATFAIDPHTGGLTPTGHVAHVPNPVCVEVMGFSQRTPGMAGA